ncbi:MAG TPA: dephospho-CoA kinase [Cyclobacteriaceae bacterium]
MMPMQIGLTGGIGAGKSLVGRIFQTLGIPLYNADSRAKYVMTTDGILISNIKKEFGELSFHPDGSLNRRFLSEQVFHDKERLEVLNKLVHPRVLKDYQEWVSEHVQYEYVIKEAALLFESGSYKLLDNVILVVAPEAIRIERVVQRDKGRSRDQIRQIMAQQLSDEEKMKLADAVIWNDESRLVIPQVLELHEQYSMRGKHQVSS